MSVCEVGATIGRMWREMSDTNKQHFNDDFALDKVGPSHCHLVIIIIIIIIIIERKDLGGVMSKDCKDTLQTLKTVTKRKCDAK